MSESSNACPDPAAACGCCEGPNRCPYRASLPLPPHGPTHHYAPLHYQGRDDQGRETTRNCRCTIMPARNCPDR